jgi:hypothetical protein
VRYVICPTRGFRIGRIPTAALHDSTAAPVHGEPNGSEKAALYVRATVRGLTLIGFSGRRLLLLTATAALLTACAADVGTSSGRSSASQTASTPTAGTSPRELPGEGDLTAGSYFLSEFPAAITFDIPPLEPPAVWFACSPSAVEQAVCYQRGPGQVVAVTFQIVDNVVAECADQETAALFDPPVGPSVDDLVTAISSLDGYEATAPVDITVSGFEGKEFTLTAVRHACGATWATADRITGMGAGESNLLRILDVDGVRVVIAGAYTASTPEADVANMEQVMDSVQIEP